MEEEEEEEWNCCSARTAVEGDAEEIETESAVAVAASDCSSCATAAEAFGFDATTLDDVVEAETPGSTQTITAIDDEPEEEKVK